MKHEQQKNDFSSLPEKIDLFTTERLINSYCGMVFVPNSDTESKQFIINYLFLFFSFPPKGIIAIDFKMWRSFFSWMIVSLEMFFSASAKDIISFVADSCIVDNQLDTEKKTREGKLFAGLYWKNRKVGHGWKPVMTTRQLTTPKSVQSKSAQNKVVSEHVNIPVEFFLTPLFLMSQLSFTNLWRVILQPPSPPTSWCHHYFSFIS